MAQTDQEYHNNTELWGEAQFVTLENIVDNLMILADDDDYLKNVKRFRVETWGKLGLKKLNVDIQPDNKAISFVVPPSQIFAFPRYMTNWKRASVINACEKLSVLDIKNEAQIVEYLSGNDGELFFDECDGSLLTGDEFDATQGHCCYEFECTITPECSCQEEDFSESWVKENKKAGYFQFSPDLVGRTIVLEFSSAGLDNMDACDIKVHNDLEQTLMLYIQWNLLKGKKNAGGKWKEYYSLYKLEKRRSNDLLSDKITLQQIIKAVSIRYN